MTRLNRLSREWAFALAVMIGLIAISVLIGGWGMGIVAIRRIRPDFAAMVPTTALVFLLISIAILLQYRPGPLTRLTRITHITALIVLGVAIADIAVILMTDANGLDMLFWPGMKVFQTDSMAIATATCMILAGICLWRMEGQSAERDPIYTAAATVGLIFSGVALIGYIFDSTALYEVSLFTAMALHTSISFVALFIALILLRQEAGWASILTGEGGGSAGARRLLPGAIILPFTLCLISLYATRSGIMNANFRISVVAIMMMVLPAAAVLYYANIQNKIESRLRAALDDRDLLLREVYHRVKNNLQMTTALLLMGKRATTDEQAKALISATIKRVESIGIVHRLLLSARIPSQLTVSAFLNELCDNIREAGNDTVGQTIGITVNSSDDHIHIETAVTLGLLINEIVTNAIKHAFPDGRNGQITVVFQRQADGDAILRVEDNGIGYNPGDTPSKEGVGTGIISGLVGQLDAVMSINSDAGTAIEIKIPAATFDERNYDG